MTFHVLHQDTNSKVVGISWSSRPENTKSENDLVVLVSCEKSISVYSLPDPLCLKSWLKDANGNNKKKKKPELIGGAVLVPGSYDIVAFSETRNTLFKWNYFDAETQIPESGQHVSFSIFDILVHPKLLSQYIIIASNGKITVNDTKTMLFEVPSNDVDRVVGARLFSTSRPNVFNICLIEVYRDEKGDQGLRIRNVSYKIGHGSPISSCVHLCEITNPAAVIIHSNNLVSVVSVSRECSVFWISGSTTVSSHTANKLSVQNDTATATLASCALQRGSSLSAFGVADTISIMDGKFGVGSVTVSVPEGPIHALSMVGDALIVACGSKVFVKDLKASGELAVVLKPSTLSSNLFMGVPTVKSFANPDMTDMLEGSFDANAWKRKLERSDKEVSSLMNSAKKSKGFKFNDTAVADKMLPFLDNILSSLIEKKDWSGVQAMLSAHSRPWDGSVIEKLIENDQALLVYQFVVSSVYISEYYMTCIFRYALSTASTKRLNELVDDVAKTNALFEKFINYAKKAMGKEEVAVVLFFIALTRISVNEVFLVHVTRKLAPQQLEVLLSIACFILSYIDEQPWSDKSSSNDIFPSLKALLSWCSVLIDAHDDRSKPGASIEFHQVVSTLKSIVSRHIHLCDVAMRLEEPLKVCLKINRRMHLKPLKDYSFEAVSFQ